jgi:putative flippase GtrA
MRFTKEIQYFLIVGILTVLIDYLVYSLSRKLIINTTQAKAVGFISGTFFAFLVNRKLTFKNYDNIWVHLYKFLILYSVTLFINVTINKYLLNWLNDFHFKVQLSFLIATSISAIINFIGMKYFVFIIKYQKKEIFEKN